MRKSITIGTVRSVKANAVLNAVRQSSALLFSLITFPYVSRILGNVQYGRYSFSSSVVNYFLLLSGFGISNYAVREGSRIREDRQKLSELVSELFSLNLITMVISYLLLGLLMQTSDRIGNYRALILIQSISIFFAAVGVDWVNIIFEDFLYITIRYIAIQIVAFVSILLFIREPQDTWKYCLILVFASYGGNLVNLIYIRKYVSVRIRRLTHLRKYLLSMTILFGNSLATMIYVNSDITMLGFFWPDAVVGIYAFSSRIYNVLKQMINGVVVVTVPRLAHMKETNEKQYNDYAVKIFRLLLMVIFPVTTGFFILTNSILHIIGGNAYVSGSDSFRILLLALAFALSASVFTNCILIINRLEKYCLLSTVISAAANIGLNFIMVPRWGAEGAAATTVFAEMLNLCLQYGFSRKTLGISLKEATRDCISIFTGSCAVAIICLGTKQIIMNGSMVGEFIRVLMAFTISVPFYFIVLFFMKNEFVCEAMKRIGKKKNSN